MRLTTKFNELLHYDNNEKSHYTTVSLPKTLEKLGRLEDVEDDLGLDLGIFAKTLKYGGYIKTAFGIEKFKIQNSAIDFKGKLFYATTEHTLRILLFKDYGKTWALDEKELTKEKNL